MRVFDKVASIKVNDNTYNLLDTVERETFNTEYNDTRRLDGILLANKTNLATAITNKGVTTSPNDSLLQFAENISNIEAGDKPSKGLMKSIKAYTEMGLTSSNSVRYYYPFVGRTGSGMGSFSLAKGSGGYYFSDNIEFSDCIAITRLIRPSTSLYGTVLFLNCYIPVHAVTRNNNVRLCYGVNKATKDFNIPDGISKTDYYIKIDLKKTARNSFLINIYFANADIDGNPTEFILSDFVIYSGAQTPAPRTELYLSVLGVSPEFSSYTYINAETDPASTGERLTLRYKNYIKETCLALKNSEGIYKVALGASTIFPY